MSRRDDRFLLQDILEASLRIESYIAGMDYASFQEDTKTHDAVIRNLEIIGEAAKSLTPELIETHGYVPWQSMARLRDRLIHHYFGVNLDIVWEIAVAELPDVAFQIEAMLRDA